MIPSLVVSEVREALVEYLATTFALSDDETRKALSEFLTREGDGINMKIIGVLQNPSRAPGLKRLMD